MLAIYLLTLGVSAGVVGVFFRTLLAESGYVPDFQAGVAVAIGAASAYVALQLVFMTVVRFFWPTRSHVPILADCVSHASVLALLPALSGVDIHWPHPILERFESLLFLGVFLGIHTLLKLFTFYSVLQADPGKRLGSLIWTAFILVFAVVAYVPFTWWLNALRGFQPHASASLEPYRYDGAYAAARAIPEGALVEADVADATGRSLTFRWAPILDDSDEDPLPGVFASVTMEGDEATTYSAWVPFDGAGWSVLTVPQESVPENVTQCGVFWYEEQEPKWRSALGIRPIIQDGRKVMVSGPFAHTPAADASSPNVVLVIVDGLGTDRVSTFGGKEETTPFLDHFGQTAVVFPNAYTAAPSAEAAMMTILTGTSPLFHGYLGDHAGPLPEACPAFAEEFGRAGYATAAFMEGDARGGFAYGSGFDRGFEHYDVSFVIEEAEVSDEETETPVLGSARTLARALHWIGANQHAHFAVVVYLSELRDMTYREYYEDPVAATNQKPSNDAVYNAGLRYLDGHIGEFIRGLRGLESEHKVCVAVTSTHGADFSLPYKLTESVLRVPLWIEAPGVEPVVRRDLALLEELAPTMAGLAGVTFGDNRSLLSNPVTVEPISMAGTPVVLTIRNDRWRLYWSSQRDPFTGSGSGQAPSVSLYDLTRLRTGQPLQDVAAQQRDIVDRWSARLEAYLENQSAVWK